MMLLTAIRKNSTILGMFAAVTAGLIAATYQGTKTRILAAERLAQQKALFEIVPPGQHDNDLLADTKRLDDALAQALHVPAGTEVHIAKKSGVVKAIIIPAVAPDGYSGAIKLIVGVNTDGTVAGVRVLSHKETPGLGDKVDLAKSDWILGFTNKSLANPQLEQWAVKKDGGAFDAFSGATITPRAVVRQVKETLLFFQTHKTLLLEASETTP